MLKMESESVIRKLRPDLQMRLRFITHLNVDEITTKPAPTDKKPYMKKIHSETSKQRNEFIKFKFFSFAGQSCLIRNLGASARQRQRKYKFSASTYVLSTRQMRIRTRN